MSPDFFTDRRLLFALPLLLLMPVLPAQNGRALFAGKGCVRCHSIDHRGGSLGPDLTEIGLKRSAASLRTSILDPDAEIFREYLTVVITTADGHRLEGIGLNEDDVSIQIRDREGNPRSFLKSALKDVHREQRSLMPSYSGKLSAAELAELVRYLESRKGAAEPAAGREPGPLTTDLAWLTRANRDSQERPELLLDSLGIRPGFTVVDLGAGAGYFTWRLARRVGDAGKVIAVDIQQSMLDRIAADIQQRRLKNVQNVQLVLGTPSDPKLPAGVADLVLIANAYHEFSEPAAMMAAVHRALKPNGRVVVVEYAEEKDDDPVAGLYAMSLAQLRGEIEALGWELDRTLDFLPLQNGLIFRKRGQPITGHL
jgi:putative heme-binding domain-containing protein